MRWGREQQSILTSTKEFRGESVKKEERSQADTFKLGYKCANAIAGVAGGKEKSASALSGLSQEADGRHNSRALSRAVALVQATLPGWQQLCGECGNFQTGTPGPGNVVSLSR